LLSGLYKKIDDRCDFPPQFLSFLFFLLLMIYVKFIIGALKHRAYHLVPFDYCQVFTWYGATIEMDGVTETDYTADEVGLLVSFLRLL